MKLQLHRSEQKPDWELIASAKRNWWQRLASATNGIVTPGNCMTVLGVAFVGYGIFLLPAQLFYGVVFIAIGRVFDLLDGTVADATGTKSSLGELFDATADKLTVFGVGIAVSIFGLVSWVIIGLLFVQNIANVLIGYSARKRHITLHPSAMGKVTTALQWVGIIALIATHSAPSWQPLAYALIFAGFATGVIATRGYLQTVFR